MVIHNIFAWAGRKEPDWTEFHYSLVVLDIGISWICAAKCGSNACDRHAGPNKSFRTFVRAILILVKDDNGRESGHAQKTSQISRVAWGRFI